MNRSTTEIPKDMFKSLKTISLSLAALLLGAGSACGQQSDSYAHKVNTLIGTRGVGLTSGYLYPGATYPFGMVQFTPTYFAKRGGFVINQLSGGGCSHMGNFPTFPVTGKLDSSPENILDYRVGICGEQGHAGYYEATVQEAVKAQLTVTERTGMARYEYPAGEAFGTVIIGAGIAATPIEQAAVVITGPNSCEGYAEGGSFCGVRTRSTSSPSSTRGPSRRASGKRIGSPPADVSPRGANRASTSRSTSPRTATYSTRSAFRTSRWRTPAQTSRPKTPGGISRPCSTPPNGGGTTTWG